MHADLDPKSLLRDERITVYFLPVLIFIASGILSNMLIRIHQKTLIDKFKQSDMAKYLLISTTLVSWSIAIFLFIQYIVVIRYMDYIIDVDPTLRAYRDFFKAQTKSGYVQLALFIFSFLISLLSCWCSVKHYYKLHRRGPLTTQAALQGTQFECSFCKKNSSVIIKGMYFAMISGYVSCVQMTSVFAFHCALYFFVNPLYTIIRAATTVIAVSLPVLFLIVLQSAIVCCIKWCRCPCVCCNMIDCKILFLLSVISTIAFSILLYMDNLFAKGVKGLVAESLLSSGVLMTSIIASIIVTMLGYLTKKIIYRKVPNDLQLQQNPV